MKKLNSYNKNVVVTAIQVIVKILSVVCLMKLAANSFSVSEYAHYSQFINLNQILMLMSGVWCTTAVVSLIAAEKHQVEVILSTSFLLSVLTSFLFLVIIFILFIFFFDALSINFFAYKMLFGLSLVSIFNNLILIIQSKLNAANEFNKLNLTIITVSITNLFCGIAFFYVIDEGMYYYLLISPILSFFLINKKQIILRLIFFRYFSYSVAKELSKFVFMGVVTVTCVYISQFFLRELYLSKFGPNWVGLWQVGFKLSELYLMLFSSVFAIFIIPMYARINSNFEAYYLAITVFKKIFVISIFLGFIQYLLAPHIIKLAFSSIYIEAVNFYYIQIFSDFFKIVSWVFCYVFLSRGMVKIYISLEILSMLVLIVLCFIFNHLDMYYSLNYAYLGQSIFYLILSFYLLLRGKDERSSYGYN